MMKKEECLRVLAGCRTDEVVVTTMGVAEPWARLSDHDRDFASVDSGMGHAADFALGIALARPDLMVWTLNGDGSMLMNLGTLVTIVDSGARNLVLFVVENRTYEVTGNQAIPGAGRFRFSEIARACGFPRVYEYSQAEGLRSGLPEVLSEAGPAFVTLFVDPGREGPPKRGAANPARYLRDPLSASVRALREVLAKP